MKGTFICEDIMSLPDFSYFIVAYYYDNNHKIFSLYNKETFTLIEEIQPKRDYQSHSFHCHLIKENIIFFSDGKITEVWKKEKNKKFTKIHEFYYNVNSNFLLNSKSQLLFYSENYIEIWKTEDYYPKQLNAKIPFGNINKLNFFNNQKILAAYNADKISIALFSSKTYKKIGYFKGNFSKIYKFDETHLLCIKKEIREKGGFYEPKKIQIFKIPEFNLEKSINISHFIENVLFNNKRLFLCSEAFIEIYNHEHSVFEEDIYILNIHNLFYLKDNYIIGTKKHNNDSLIIIYKIIL